VEKNWLEWTNQWSFVYPTGEELIPTIGWEGVREGIDDYRYLKTLSIAIQEAKKRKADIDVIKNAENLLKEIEEGMPAENSGEMQKTAESVEYNKLRYQVAQQIINLEK
jgi:hypothetical protein